jgi:hypothetical protein
MFAQLSSLSSRQRAALAVVALAGFALAVGLGYQFGFWLGQH